MGKLPATLHTKMQLLSKQQRLTGLRQKLLDDQRARTMLHATVAIKKISLLAKQEPLRFAAAQKKEENGTEANIRYQQHSA